MPKHDLFTCFKRSVIQALFNTFFPFPPFLPTKASTFSIVYLNFFLRIIPSSNHSFYVVDNSIHTTEEEKEGVFFIINEDCKFRGWGTEFFYGTATELCLWNSMEIAILRAFSISWQRRVSLFSINTNWLVLYCLTSNFRILSLTKRYHNYQSRALSKEGSLIVLPYLLGHRTSVF